MNLPAADHRTPSQDQPRPPHPPHKTAVVFQGGGALGAFGAGAWQVLGREPGLRGGELVAVAGASIGAINAAAAVRHFGDEGGDEGGAEALAALWRDRIATPSWPFVGALPMPLLPSHAGTEQWNGFITGMLLGNRGLYVPAWPAWLPMAGMSRLQQPLHDRRAMWQLLEGEFGTHTSAPGGAPMLAVASVDVMSGELQLFDSDSAALTPAHLAASSAIPLLFDPVEIDQRLCWDGEVTRESLLPLLLQRLLQTGRLARGEPLRLITIEQFPRVCAARPQSGAEIAYRALNLMQLGKLDLPPAAQLDGLGEVQHLRVLREPLAEDGVSGQFDYSPGRIERLMAQGREAAHRALGHTAQGDTATGRMAPDHAAPADDVSPPDNAMAALATDSAGQVG